MLCCKFEQLLEAKGKELSTIHDIFLLIFWKKEQLKCQVHWGRREVQPNLKTRDYVYSTELSRQPKEMKEKKRSELMVGLSFGSQEMMLWQRRTREDLGWFLYEVYQVLELVNPLKKNSLFCTSYTQLAKSFYIIIPSSSIDSSRYYCITLLELHTAQYHNTYYYLQLKS